MKDSEAAVEHELMLSSNGKTKRADSKARCRMFIESWGDDPRFPGLTLELEADLRIREHPPGGNEIGVECLLRISDPQIGNGGMGLLDLTGAWNTIQAALLENKSAIAAALDALPSSSDQLAAISPQYRAMRERARLAQSSLDPNRSGSARGGRSI